MKLLIVGGTAVDLVFRGAPRLPRWPRHTEFTPANLVLLSDPPIVTVGGNGANAAYVAAACGADVTLHTAIGDDPLGRLARAWLEGAGCRVHSGTKGRTPVNVTIANRRMQRATLFYPGARVSMPLWRADRTARATARYVLVCGWPHPAAPEIAQQLGHARRGGAFTCLDVGPLLGRPWSALQLSAILRPLDLLIANEYEAKRIAAARTLDAALEKLRSRCAGHLVIKRGPKGALWLPAGSGRPQRVAAPPTRAVNTIGAGDAFNGALLAALAGGEAFPAALQRACQEASRVVASGLGVLGVPAGRSGAGLRRTP